MMSARMEGASARPVAVPLRPDWLGALLAPDRPGVYVLLAGGRPRYVGRSDVCLLGRLSSHELRREATHVVWGICRGAAQAYHAECYWLHRLAVDGVLLNRNHPAAPVGTALVCSFCGPALDAAAAAVGALARTGRVPAAGTWDASPRSGFPS